MPPSETQIDLVRNGQGHGGVAAALLQNNFNTDALRPYIDKYGRSCITRNVGGKLVKVPTTNANATLLKDEWIKLDEVVVKAALPGLKAVADLRGRGLTYNIPNGLASTVLQSQAQSDIGPATVSMDGLADNGGDRPVYNLTNLPLPIIHRDFSFSARQIAVSRKGNMPLDLSTAELAARKVAEGAEQMLIGSGPTIAYGGGQIFGYTNFPQRITKALHDPTASGWVPRTLLLDVLSMRQLSTNKLHYGPWILYISRAWDSVIDDDLSIYKGSTGDTLRNRLKEIDGITDVVTLDFLKGYDMVLVQTTPEVVREVVGMDITTVQWESHGGMQVNFKVMCILVPQLRADYNGNTGIVHGSVAGFTTGPSGVNYMPAYNA